VDDCAASAVNVGGGERDAREDHRPTTRQAGQARYSKQLAWDSLSNNEDDEGADDALVVLVDGNGAQRQVDGREANRCVTGELVESVQGLAVNARPAKEMLNTVDRTVVNDGRTSSRSRRRGWKFIMST
jgi:hypothetical protein